jgi:hypothetical protein
MSRLLGAAVASLLALGCSADRSGSGAGVEPDGARPPVVPGREVIFRGACDASGAVPLSAQRFVVADDEDNILRVYDADAGGEPRSQTDLSAALGLPLEGKKHPKAAELDLEAATTVGERAYWLTSHGRNKKGKLAPARLHFFATSTFVDERGDALQLVGHPYDRLVDDLAAAPHLAGFGLADAAQRAPKAEGGLNIEGLTAAPDGPMLLGFRNPVPQGRALVVPLLNPAALVDAPDGGPARFGAPILLDLGQRGVRSLSWWRGRYLLIAGHHAEAGSSTLFTWDGRGAPAATAIDLSGYNPEGFFTPEDRDEILVVSDDGERLVDGTPCKKLKDPAQKQFRGVWLALP